MITVELVKSHLRFDEDESGEDIYLQHLIDSANSAFESFSNRTLLADDETLPDPVGNAILSNKTIEQGALLLIGHWYLNRESVVVGVTGTELPLTTNRLWSPFRWAHF